MLTVRGVGPEPEFGPLSPMKVGPRSSPRLSPTSALTEDGRFVFSLSDGSDWRYGNVIALTATVTTQLSLKLSNTLRYLHRPVFGLNRRMW